ncbi:MAG: nitrilase-related carbon-nitrogen hydrolase [Nitrospirota bacterium]
MKINEVSLGVTRKDKAIIMIGQPSWKATDWSDDGNLLALLNEDSAKQWVDAFLTKARQVNCDLLVLPELSIPEKLTAVVASWSAQTGCIVVAGSHYASDRGGFVARCPVVYRDQVYYIDKIHPAPVEMSPLPGKSIIAGTELTVFSNTSVGTFGVLICSDYLADRVKAALRIEMLDVLCVISCQRDSSMYHKRMDIDTESAEKGIYILYANSRIENISDGRSALFALTDTMYQKAFKKAAQRKDGPGTMLVELPDNKDFLVAAIDIDHKRPVIPRTVNVRPNVQLIEQGVRQHTPSNLNEPAKVGRVKSPSRKGTSNFISDSVLIREEINRLIAKHGIDDENWAKAFSSIYFLSQLAETMKREDSTDYRRLLDQFLTYFRFRADDTIALIEDRILVTPDENRNIRAAMVEEDARDPYFAKTPKTKAANIDMQMMHENYLYGVALGISARQQTRVMSTIRDTAISHLVHDTRRPSRDPGGGWIPYRVPWITARIIAIFAKVDVAGRPDASPIKEAIEQGLSSLIHRLDQGGYWKSGVGTWVSKWECTALCLEAFLLADTKQTYKSVIAAVLGQILRKTEEWIMADPGFDTDAKANDTLASVLMSSVVLRLCANYIGDPSLVTHENEKRMLSVMLHALRESSDAEKIHQRQFSTVPQIAAYCAAACVQ